MPYGQAWGVLVAAAVTLTTANAALAQESRAADLQVAIEAVAPDVGIDPSKNELIAEIFRIPTTERDRGFVCGAILPRSANRQLVQFRSFQESLRIEDGQLIAGAISPLFMPIEELRLETICQP